MEESNIHLLFNGQMLVDPDTNVQSCGIKSGSVLEMVLSRSDCIKTILSSMVRSVEVDMKSVFLLHLVYVQLGRNLSRERIVEYFNHCHMGGVTEWLREYDVGEVVSEADFIAVSLSLQSSQSLSPSQRENIRSAISVYSLPSESSEHERNVEWVIDFSELQKLRQEVDELRVKSLWEIPVECIESEKRKDL